jgi:MFS family permease
VTDTAAPLRNRHAAAAVAALFFVNGMVFSNWLPRLPEIRERLGVDNGGIGTSMLGGGLGGIIGSVLVAQLMRRFGSRALLFAAATTLAVLMPLVGIVPSPFAFFAALTVLGMLDVLNDMAMNTQGVMVEHRIGRSIMNRLHGGWSLGFTTGAVFGSLAAAVDLDLRIHLLIVAAALLGTVFAVRNFLVRADEPTGPKPDHAPRRRVSWQVIAMAVTAAGAMVLELIPSDWAAIIFTDVFDARRAAGVGTVTFAAAMLIGRFSGDHVLERIGPRRLLATALTLTVCGSLIAVISPTAWVLAVGLAVWGLGVSVLFPQLYAIAVRASAATGGLSVGGMAVGQRLGAMLAPVGFGNIAAAWNLKTAVAVFAVIGVTLTAAGTRKP